MFCNNCGHEVPEGSSFCTNCGTPVEVAGTTGAPAASQPAAPPPPAPGAPPGPMSPPPVSAGAPAPFAVPAAAQKKSKTGLVLIIAGVALLVVVAVVLVLVFTVFKGDTGKARELVKKADGYMAEVQTASEEASSAFNDMIENIDNVDTAAQFRDATEDLRSYIRTARSKLKAAEKEYKEVKELSGVEKYKSYADIVLELIALDFEIQDATTEFLDYIEGQYEAADAGRSVDVDEISETSSEYIQNANSMGEEAGELVDKAEKYRSDNHLY